MGCLRFLCLETCVGSALRSQSVCLFLRCHSRGTRFLFWCAYAYINYLPCSFNRSSQFMPFVKWKMMFFSFTEYVYFWLSTQNRSKETSNSNIIQVLIKTTFYWPISVREEGSNAAPSWLFLPFYFIFLIICCLYSCEMECFITTLGKFKLYKVFIGVFAGKTLLN